MRAEKDFEEFLSALNRNKVRYCIIGAFAVAFHGRPRYTKDMDVLVEPSVENAKKVIRALKDFGFGSTGLTEEDFAKEGAFVQLGYEPVRIDVITSIGGCSFDQIWQHRKVGEYGAEKVNFIGLDELIKSKKAAGRKGDIRDIDILLAARAQAHRK